MYKSILMVTALAFFTFSCSECEAMQKLQLEKDQLALELAASQAELAETQKDCETPGLIHSVFFWLKEGISDTDRNAFLAGVASLEAIESVRHMYVGPPAATEERGVVDNSYSIALIVHFDDLAGQDAYQVDPIHLKFVEELNGMWTKVVVYDNMVTNLAPSENR
jgi:hypothetical protein